MASKNRGPQRGGRNNQPDPITRWIVIGMVLLVVVIGAVFTVVSNKSASNVALPPGASAADGYGIVFNADKSPTINIWEDFQCPSCKRFEDTNGAKIAEVINQGKAKVVFNTLSFLGPESVVAGMGAGCAADQGKFLEYKKFLYDNQQQEGSGTWDKPYIISMATAMGLDETKFSACLNTDKYRKWLTNVSAAGGEANINGTPTVVIDGNIIESDQQGINYYTPEGFNAQLVKYGIN
ncbi:MAG: protein-disulfide isomerase [Actinobacteria bacterium]|nr:protein-disulfide isomerase [Actinomycetota bacterium]